MESALEGIENQLRSEGVMLTLDILRHAKRFQATVSFSADTGLKEATERVQKYNQLMRDFPLDELLSATSLPKVEDALGLIYGHLNKKLRICPYPIRRALPLVEAISADLDTQLHSLLHGRSLMHLEYRDFKNLMATADTIWRAWDENVKEFTNVAREVTRRRNEKFIPIKIARETCRSSSPAQVRQHLSRQPRAVAENYRECFWGRGLERDLRKVLQMELFSLKRWAT